MVNYDDTTEEQQNLTVPYPFVEYEGNEFINAYLESRTKAVDFLNKKLNDNILSIILDAKEKLLEKIRSEQILETKYILKILCELIEEDNSEEMIRILKNLRKKGELRKLKTHYRGEKLLSSRIEESKDVNDVDTYVLLSLSLARHADYNELTDSLQSLSTLLKINDFIISRIEEVDNEQIDLFRKSISLEVNLVSELKKVLSRRTIRETLKPFDIEQKEKNIIQNLGMIAQDKPRARAYIQGLVKSGMIPSCLVIVDETFGKQIKKDTLDRSVEGEFFNSEESIIQTAEKWKIPYKIVNAKDFNDTKVIDALKKLEPEYFIFSGTGILKKEILNTKRLIHAHPGWLPEFRGSTTFLFSLLAEGNCSATCFVMNEGIDTGDVIIMKKFNPPSKNTDLSRIYDPYIRSIVIIDTVKQLKEKNELKGYKQDPESGETYFTIHPVLRTLAVGYYKEEVKDFDV